MNALNALSANTAYARASGQLTEAAGGAAISRPAGVGGGESFGDVLKNMVGSVNEAAKASEQASLSGLNKDMDLTDVVAAVSNAEMVIDTVVAVRDKVIQAYQEILRMPI